MSPRIEALQPLFERLNGEMTACAASTLKAASLARSGDVEWALGEINNVRHRLSEALLALDAIDAVRRILTNERNDHE